MSEYCLRYNSLAGKFVRCKKPPSRKGIELTEEHKRKVSEALKGKPKEPFTLSHRKNLSLSHLGKKNPKASKTKKELFERGVLKPWNKGFTKETNEIMRRISEKLRKPIMFTDTHRLNRKEWREIREKVFELYGKICLDCEAIDNIDIHHLIPYRLCGSNELFLLVPLCDSCHRKWENVFRNELEEKYFKEYLERMVKDE